MPNHHDDIELTAGDDWTITGNLVDTSGEPLDLTTVTNIQWILLGPNGQPCLPPGSVMVMVVDPPTDGQVQVVIPNELTKTLAPGRYSDALRVIFPEDYLTTVWTGQIAVDADPFDAIDNPPPLTPPLN